MPNQIIQLRDVNAELHDANFYAYFCAESAR
jgi:hypothetical protein